MAFLDNVTRGGQTWAHHMRMFKQVSRMMLLGSIGLGVGFFAIKMSKEPKENFQAVCYYVKATLPFAPDTIEVDGKFWCKVSRQCFRNKQVKVRTKDLVRISKERIDLLFSKGSETLKEAGFFSLGIALLSFICFNINGIFKTRKKHLQGVRFEKSWKVRLKMTCLFKKSDVRLGNVPLVKDSETKHLLICGATGTGKTNALRSLMKQIRRNGDRAIIVDTTGDFVSKFFREEKDILFNPYDKRSKEWHPWCECVYDYDYEQLVSSLIPKNETRHDDFFQEAGRAVILAALKKHQESENFNLEELVDDLLTKSVSDLYTDFSETPAKIYLDPQGERTTVSIRANIANTIRHFSMLKNSKDPFSIRDWVLSENASDEWLFFTCQTEQRKALNSLLSVWFSVALNAIKRRTPSQAKQKIWLIIDELHAMQKLEYLEESLAELRKYGGAIVLATQNISQVDKLYGHHSARVILDQCSTKISFRQSDADIAKRMSSFFGQQEFKEIQEGLSYGAHEMRDGVNLSNIERIKPVVSPTQILTLPDLEAFIKLPGNWPALKTKFKYFKQNSIAESYIRGGGA